MKLIYLLSIWTCFVSTLVIGFGPDKPTIFNGQEVPLMPNLKGDDLTKSITNGNWLVELYSPYCGHCKHMAPTWQTFYEFYYTLKPVESITKSDSVLNTFSNYYDFKFGKLDCVQWGDVCTEIDKEIAFPTIIWFQNGKLMKKSVGSQDLAGVSKWFEEILESIRPGSRPKDGPKLPEVGAPNAPNQPSPTANTSSPTEIPSVPTNLNVKGESVALTYKTFEESVLKSKDAWFVKFYAPWCPHCQHMASAWNEMARDVKGEINIGEVNCDIESKLCKESNVQGFPTLVLFKNGEKVEYDGLRKVGDLVTYAKSAASAISQGILEMNAADFKNYASKEEVVFVYHYDGATVTEDFTALDRVLLSLVGHGKLVKSKDPELASLHRVTSKPALVVSRDSLVDSYPYLAPKDLRNYRQMLKWMQTVWQPLVPELTANNAHEVMDKAYVVLAVLNRDANKEEQFRAAKRELKAAAKDWIAREKHVDKNELQELRDGKQFKIDNAKQRGDRHGEDAIKATKIEYKSKRPKVKFAWVDGVFWERWLKDTYGVKSTDGEKIIVVDDDNQLYWDVNDQGKMISPIRTAMLDILPKILKHPSAIASKSSASKIGSIYYWARGSWRHHPFFSSFVLVVFLCGAILYRQRIRGRKSLYFNLDGAEKGIIHQGGKND